MSDLTAGHVLHLQGDSDFAWFLAVCGEEFLALL